MFWISARCARAGRIPRAWYILSRRAKAGSDIEKTHGPSSYQSLVQPMLSAFPASAESCGSFYHPFACAASLSLHRPEPASDGGLKACCSFGMLSAASNLESTVAAREVSFESASIPIQNTRGARVVGKIHSREDSFRRRRPRWTEEAFFISSACDSDCSPINFRVMCSDSGRTQRVSGANSRTPSRKRAMRFRILSSISSATKRRIRAATSFWLLAFTFDLLGDQASS